MIQMDRKVKKPLMEKRRRARINDCLSELKAILLQTYSSSPPQVHQRTSKLEKADILEMTVEYVRSRAKERQYDPASVGQAFVDGYRECAQSALQFVPHCERGAFMAHLTTSLNNRMKGGNSPSAVLTLSIPTNVSNHASQPTPPFTLSHFPFPHNDAHPVSSSLISPMSASISDRSSPCDSTYSSSASIASSSVAPDHVLIRKESGLLTPVTPTFVNGKTGGAIWRPW